MIKYKDAEGAVIDTIMVEPNAIIPQTSVPVVPELNYYLDYWYIEGSDPEEVISFGTSRANANITLLPHFSNTYSVIYISEGTQVNPTVVTGGSQLTKPANPTREGYTFKNWSTLSDTTFTEYNFANPVNSNLILYAQWTPRNNVGYTVAVWMEKANLSADPNYVPTAGNFAEYDYVGSYSATGTADNATAINAQADLSQVVRYGFSGSNNAVVPWTILKYAQFQNADNKVIQGNGSTVVNVFAQRKVYTFNFDVNNNSYRMTIGTTTYTNSSTNYSFRAKYEQNVSSAFPVSGGNATFQYNSTGSTWINTANFAGWSAFGNGASYTGTWASKWIYIGVDMVATNGQQLSYTLNGTYNTDASYLYRYFVEVLPGQAAQVARSDVGYVLMTEYSQSLKGNLEYKSIPGLTVVKADYETYYLKNGAYTTTPPTTGTYDTLRCFFYTRTAYNLTFYGNPPAGAQSTVQGVPAQRSIKYGVSNGLQPTSNPTLNGYTFVGWYKEAALVTPFEFNTPMPAANQAAYAKWESTANTVTFYDSTAGDHAVGTQGVATNAHIKFQDAPFIAGQAYEKGTFKGWYWYVGGVLTAYNPDIPVFGNYQLYADWVTSDFTVTYDGNGNTSGTVPTDGDRYNIEVAAPVLNGSGLVKNSLVFSGWKIQNPGTQYYSGIYYPGASIPLYSHITLVAQYIDKANAYEVIYHSNNSQSATKSYFVPKDQILQLPGNVFDVTPQGFVFDYWTETTADLPPKHSAGSQLSVAELATLAGSDGTIDLYAQWKLRGFEVRFQAGSNGTLAPGAQTVFSDIASGTNWGTVPIVVPTPTATSGFQFAHWLDGNGNKIVTFADHAITSNEIYTAIFLQPITITAGSDSRAYNGNPLTSSDYTTANLPDGVTVSNVVTAGTVTNVDTQSNIIQSYKLYLGAVDVTAFFPVTKVPGTLTITSVTLTPVVDDKTIAYGDAAPTLTFHYTGYVNGEGQSAITAGTASTTYGVGDPAGTYPISLTAGSATNYIVPPGTGKLTVTLKEIDITDLELSAATQLLLTKVYGNNDPALADIEAAINGELATFLAEKYGATVAADFSVALDARKLGEDVGTYAYGVTINYDDANYTLKGSIGVALTITPRPATVSAVAASKPYAEADPTFTATTTGFLNGEAPTVAQYTVTRSNAGTEAVGSYPGVIVVANNATDGYSNSNYTVTWSPATFTITDNPALNINVTVTANSASFVYNNAQQVVNGYTVSGLPVNDLFSYEIGVSGATATNVSTTPNILEFVGIYYNGVNVTDKINLTRNNGALTITQRPVILTVSGATKVVGTADDFSGVTAIFNDALATGAFASVSIGRTNGFTAEAVGTYANAITAYFFNNPNFAVTVVNGTLTITAAAVVPPVVPPVVPVVPAAPPAAPVIIPNPDVPLAPVTIADPETPLAQPITASWALINLILAIVSLIYAIYLAIGYRKRREGEKADVDAYGNKTEDTRGNRGVIWRTIAVIFGVVAPVVFFLTEDVTLPIALVDMWTLLMAVFVVIQIASAIVLRQSRKEDEDDNAQSAAY